MKKTAKGKYAQEDKEIFELKEESDLLAEATSPEVHMLGKFVCTTDGMGYRTPGNRSPLEIRVDASEGFVPLWAQNQILRWTFDDGSLSFFRYPEKIKQVVSTLLGEALEDWGDAAPVRFTENPDAHDFRIEVSNSDNCSVTGCTLARAFFPDSGRHKLTIFPRMFRQIRKEQVDTLIHETGHIFGLRHFFAKTKEGAWPSELFGTDDNFSIMNYGDLSELTPTDRRDLSRLYELVWNGDLPSINGTPVRQMRPYSTFAR